MMSYIQRCSVPGCEEHVLTQGVCYDHARLCSQCGEEPSCGATPCVRCLSKGEVSFSDGRAFYNSSTEARDEVFKRVVGFFSKHESFSGESIMQSDAPQLHASEFLSSLADEVLAFEVTYDAE
jgi:hypothetical protein